MIGVEQLMAVYIHALEKSYGVGRHEAFLIFDRKRKGSDSGCLVKNDDAYIVVEGMDREAKENAQYWRDKLAGETLD